MELATSSTTALQLLSKIIFCIPSSETHWIALKRAHAYASNGEIKASEKTVLR